MSQKISGKYLPLVIFALLLISSTTKTHAQRPNALYQEYIKKHNPLAVDQMKRYKIPASITLAQALLESGAGKSELSTKGNNHFGIKCNSDWKGKCMLYDDDRRNEKFRVYKNVSESYEDHSIFLLKSRYSSLFKLKMTDYKGWAKGLKACGYATDPQYASKLINIIELYKLHEYDNNKKQAETTQVRTYRHTPYVTHNLVYVIAEDYDTYEGIAEEFGFEAKKLQEWNEAGKNTTLKKGEIVYLEKKKKKADKPYYEHVVKNGQSVYSIAQMYGIQVKNLLKMNKLDYKYTPKTGDVLKLR